MLIKKQTVFSVLILYFFQLNYPSFQDDVNFSLFHLCLYHNNLYFIFLCRDPGPAGGAAEMSRPADRDEGPAAAGPPGFLQEEGRD